MIPFRLLYATLKLDRKFSFVNEDGMPPVRLLCDKSKDSKLDMPDRSTGMTPEIWLLLRSNTCRLLRLPKPGNMGPVSLLWLRTREGGKLLT
ncbi:hypothetical protein GQ55_1G308700 [Panicum hallii var. hallii]|uniref:Uncharacterized protein n=1 Tax=Panicum hallii var. hallii TaxID=1504633 RepID=A0A2T7F9A5_9POAL|nr:hypothetical protein GQ55_1G308700 [Panicum hallii var. hallii]